MADASRATKLPDQQALIAALRNPHVYGLAAAEPVEVLETHISHVFLAGAHAYKIKKAVNLGFLDFRTLSARHFYCCEELRLNRRFAPALYLDVVSITGTPAHPVLGGAAAPIEYAVKMRRFAQESLLDRLAARDALTAAMIDGVAAKTAEFHARADGSTGDDRFGTLEAIQQPALENFAQLRAATNERAADLVALERWTTDQCRALADAFRTRKRDGYVRECHGDLHLRNVALVDGEITPFDCIEFDANLRWIDTMNEVAFMVMDLYDRGRASFARRFLNTYLEYTGDYEGLRVLRFYVVYRALVRAKIHALRAKQPNTTAAERARLLEQYRGYVDLAKTQASGPSAALIITHGLSGSGKTTHTQSLLESIGAIRVRSDIERKRLQGLSRLARTGSAIGAGSYSADATALTYRRLLDLATVILAAGYPAIVDATFLRRRQRDMFRQHAQSHGVPFLILHVVAEEAVMRARIRARQRDRVDASEADIAVLEHQLATQEPLQPDELPFVAAYMSEQAADSGTRGGGEWTTVLKKLNLDQA